MQNRFLVRRHGEYFLRNNNMPARGPRETSRQSRHSGVLVAQSYLKILATVRPVGMGKKSEEAGEGAGRGRRKERV